MNVEFELKKDAKGDLRTEAPHGWTLIGEPNSYKLKATFGKQTFIKAFSERLHPYAQQCYLALHELSQLSLPIPILPPFAIKNGVLYFTYGKLGRKIKAESVYSDENIAKIAQIIEQYSLIPLLSPKYRPETMLLETVIINNIEYCIDPIDDNINELFEYIYPSD